MDSDLGSMELPAFELDCRDWFIETPEDGTVPEEIDGAPIIAVLSIALVDDSDLQSASAVLSIGLLDEPVDAIRVSDDGPAAEILDLDAAAGSARYIVPAPDSNLALLAEFSSHDQDARSAELLSRFETLMGSFRWAS